MLRTLRKTVRVSSDLGATYVELILRLDLENLQKGKNDFAKVGYASIGRKANRGGSLALEEHFVHIMDD